MRKITNSAINLTLVFSNNPTTIASAQEPHNGYLQSVYLTLPALDAAATATLNVKDDAGNVLYTKTGIAAGATTLCQPAAQVPVAGAIYEVVTSAPQTSNKAIVVKPYVDKFID